MRKKILISVRNKQVKTSTWKRKREPEEWDRAMKKRLRNSKEIRLDIKTPHVSCTHNTQYCSAGSLDNDDVKSKLLDSVPILS